MYFAEPPITAKDRKVVIIADSSKLGQHAFARMCAIDRVDILVTDSGAGDAAAAPFESAGVQVIRA